MEESSKDASYVKGFVILNYVKIVRANRDRDWDKYLEPQDWEIINSIIFNSNRYPYESFRRIGYAVFKLMANSDLEAARAFGKVAMQSLLQSYPKSFMEEDAPVQSLKKFSMVTPVFMGMEAGTEVVEHGEGWARYRMDIPPEEDEESVQAFCFQYAGSLEELVERAGGRDAKATIEKKGRSYEFMVKWRPASQ